MILGRFNSFGGVTPCVALLVDGLTILWDLVECCGSRAVESKSAISLLAADELVPFVLLLSFVLGCCE